jgi:imidazole glycerol phosphate synthase glutamine amidotransferase subunit
VSAVDVAVIRTGSANLASVLAALGRLGAVPRLVDDPDTLRRAPRVVLPGVGHFSAAMGQLTRGGLADAVRERIAAGAPVLAICLGLQLLAEGSDESPGTAGLGIVRGRATRLPDTVRVPQLGWNLVVPDQPGGVLQDGHAYYANSYALRETPEGWQAARTVHGTPFLAAIARGPQLACQFHPELSGRWGADLLARWWATC